MGIAAWNKEGVSAAQLKGRTALHSQQGAAVAHEMKLRFAGGVMERDAKRRAGFNPPVFNP
ncbi:hypothetical protein OUHCRE8_35550 [Enterobacter asburiae]